MVAALGIGQDGRKTILGIRQGAKENARVVGELLGALVSRGLDFAEPRLYVLDGGKALTAALQLPLLLDMLQASPQKIDLYRLTAHSALQFGEPAVLHAPLPFPAKALAP